MNRNKLHILGEHIIVTEALRDHIEHKAKSVLELDKAGTLHVRLHANRHEHGTELDMQYMDRHLRAQSQGADLYLAIDQAFEKLNRQIVKQKEIHEHKAHVSR